MSETRRDTRMYDRMRKKEKIKLSRAYATLGITGPIGPIPRYAQVGEMVDFLRKCIPKYSSKMSSIELPFISRDVWIDIAYKKSTYRDTSEFSLPVLCSIARKLAHHPYKNLYILYVDFMENPLDSPLIFQQITKQRTNTPSATGWRHQMKPWCIYLWTKEELSKKMDEVTVYHIHEA